MTSSLGLHSCMALRKDLVARLLHCGACLQECGAAPDA